MRHDQDAMIEWSTFAAVHYRHYPIHLVQQKNTINLYTKAK